MNFTRTAVGGLGNDVILGDGDIAFIDSVTSFTAPHQVWNHNLTPDYNWDSTLNSTGTARRVNANVFLWSLEINRELYQAGNHSTQVDFTLYPGSDQGGQRLAENGGNDEIHGGGGNDWIAGQTGHDIIYGDDVNADYEGNDFLVGGKGDIIGGSDKNLFY